MITYEFSPNVVGWVSRQLRETYQGAVGIGVLVDGVPACGVVYSELRNTRSGDPYDLRVSIAAVNKRWATKGSLEVLFAYPFKQVGVNRLTAVIAKKNKKSRSLAERLGFRLEGTLRRGLEDDDLCIYGLLKDEVQWLREEANGQIEPVAAACA